MIDKEYYENKDRPQWWAKGTDKDGNPLPPKPRERLSTFAAKMLDVFLTAKIDAQDKAKTMREVQALCRQVWQMPDFDRSLSSRYLQELKDKGFLNIVPGRLTKTKDRTDSVKTVRNARFWLTEKAAIGKLTIDANRWVIEDGQYIADEETRAIRESKERAKNGQVVTQSTTV